MCLVMAMATVTDCFDGSMEVEELRRRFEEQNAEGGNLSTSVSSDMVISCCS